MNSPSSIGILITIFVGVALLIGLFSLFILQNKNKQTINQIERRLHAKPSQQTFTTELIAGLPEPVQRYFLHAIAPGTPLATSVNLTMNGQFRFAPDKPWLPMQAEETIAANGFLWKAKIGRGLSQFQGADYYCDRTGRMQFSLLGLVPLVDIHNPDTARSAIGRLVTELTWLPSTLLPQQGVQWSAIDDHTIQADLTLDDEPATLTLKIDADGKLLDISVLRWGNYTSDGSSTYIPMGGTCHAERKFGGFTIPSQIGAGWWFGSDHYFEFFQCVVEQVVFE